MSWYGVIPRTAADKRAVQLYFLARTQMISKPDFIAACHAMSWEGKMAILWLAWAKADVVFVRSHCGGGTGEAPVIEIGHAHRYLP